MFSLGAPARTAQISGPPLHYRTPVPRPLPPPPHPPYPPSSPHFYPPFSDHQEAKDNEIHALNADIALLRGQQASGDDSVSVSAGVEAAIQQRLNRIADLNNTALPRVMQVRMCVCLCGMDGVQVLHCT